MTADGNLAPETAASCELDPADDFRAAAIAGLSRTEKSLPCRFLYDAQGSALFDRICELPEYYPTRTEIALLRDRAAEIADLIGPDAQVVELGSGASVKIRILLDALTVPHSYVPIDISREHLEAAANSIRRDYPGLRVTPICADFSAIIPLPPTSGQRVGFYPGSTIGNLTPAEAEDFLRRWARRLGPDSLMLIGVDLRKDAATLEAAYDDAQGVTAQFSLNVLARANRELGADFDLTGFRHQARWMDDEGRVDIRLRSLRNQHVRVAGRIFAFAEGETIHIEDSWKYTIDGFQALARRAGYAPLQVWTDRDRLFSVHLLTVSSKPPMSNRSA